MMEDKIYPDSREGVLQCLRDISTLDLTGAVAEPDSAIPGVWLVKLDPALDANRPNNAAVVYLKGYSDSPLPVGGRVREVNDFECGQLPSTTVKSRDDFDDEDEW